MAASSRTSVPAAGGEPADPGASAALLSRQRLEAKLAELFSAGPKGRVRVLDVACGPGPATWVLMASLALHRPHAQRISLDIELDPLIAARAGAAAHPGGLGGWLCADLLALPLPDQSVDFVVALNIFHGIDQRAFGLEMHRVLRPEGRVLIYDRVPQLLPFSRFALILGRDQLAHLGQLPRRNTRQGGEDDRLDLPAHRT